MLGPMKREEIIVRAKDYYANRAWYNSCGYKIMRYIGNDNLVLCRETREFRLDGWK